MIQTERSDNFTIDYCFEYFIYFLSLLGQPINIILLFADKVNNLIDSLCIVRSVNMLSRWAGGNRQSREADNMVRLSDKI